jgi:fructokinase
MARTPNAPKVYGTGLIALDVIYGLDAETPRFHAGGTCGNVLAALAFLGWDAFPISRLSPDQAGAIVRADLARWGVHQDFIQLEPTTSTPIIVEQVVRTKRGVPVHRFHLSCLQCGGWYPAFRPLREDMANAAIPQLRSPHVFFADRVSKGIVELAKHCAESGALVFFEPCGTGDTKLFRQMIQLAHVVKYSQERAKNFLDILQTAAPLLQIETLGEDGLRYQSRLPHAQTRGWKKVDAIEVAELKDAAGAGDWTSAGLINRLGRNGASGFLQTESETLAGAFTQAQAIAAWNCQFEGARGGMYASSRPTLDKFVSSASAKPALDEVFHERTPKLVSKAIELCPDCMPTRGKIAEAPLGEIKARRMATRVLLTQKSIPVDGK